MKYSSKNLQYSPEAYELLWKVMINQVPLIISGGGGMTFIGIPIIGLMALVFSSRGLNLGSKFWWFLGVYLTYALMATIALLIAKRNFEKKRGKKFDQAILIYWMIGGVTSSIISGLFQSIALVNLQDGLGLDVSGKLTSLIWFLLIDLVIIIVSLLFRIKIFDPRAFLQRWNNQDTSLTLIKPNNYLIGVVIAFIIAIIVFIFSGFKDFEVFFIFLSSYLSSAPLFFVGFVGIYRFFQMLAWRKQHFWEKEATP